MCAYVHGRPSAETAGGSVRSHRIPLHVRLARCATLALCATGLAALDLPPPVEGMTLHPAGSAGGLSHGFAEYIPHGYDDHPDRRYPVIVFFGGTGERGDTSPGNTGELGRMAGSGPLRIARDEKTSIWDFDDHANGGAAIIIGPQLSKDANEKYTGNSLDAIDVILTAVLASRRADPDRVALTGFSLGGGGVWLYAQRVPDRFAALVPICGAAPPQDHYKYHNIAGAGVWAVHCYGDGVVSHTWTSGWLDHIATEVAGAVADPVMDSYPSDSGVASTDLTAHFDLDQGWRWSYVDSDGHRAGMAVPDGATSENLRYTLFKGNGHGGWNETYNNPDVYAWLLRQTRAVREQTSMSLIIDNADAATSTVGTWSSSSGVPGYYADDYAYADPQGGSGSRFKFLPDFAQSGSYKLYLWWNAKDSRDQAVPVVIDHAGGRACLTVDQRTNGGRWNLLGTWDFAAGTGASVSVRNDDTSGWCIADAVAFERVGPPASRMRTVRLRFGSDTSCVEAIRSELGGIPCEDPVRIDVTNTDGTFPASACENEQHFIIEPMPEGLGALDRGRQRLGRMLARLLPDPFATAVASLSL
ncbi:MAG: dienelactone hydrolase family protein [Planctomycetota bacterium]